MKKYSGATIVIKYGGHAMSNHHFKTLFSKDIATLINLGVKVVIVHGGGPQIEFTAKKLGIQSTFSNGLRITDEDTMNTVEMVLSGSLNTEIVTYLNKEGLRAVGLNGKDAMFIKAKKMFLKNEDTGTNTDLGFVGEVESVDPSLITLLLSNNYIPVIAPIATDINGQSYNINADFAAGAIASALKADYFLLLTDVAGVLTKNKEKVVNLSKNSAMAMLLDQTLTGGMIPKVNCCLSALENGAKMAAIIDGREENCIINKLNGIDLGTNVTL